MKVWELYQSVSRDEQGNPTSHFDSELSEQSWFWYGLGRLPGIVWYWCDRHLPKYFTDPYFDGEESGWRIRWELWSTYDAPRWRRRTVEWVRVADRDPATWFKPGGDAPLEDTDDHSSQQLGAGAPTGGGDQDHDEHERDVVDHFTSGPRHRAGSPTPLPLLAERDLRVRARKLADHLVKRYLPHRVYHWHGLGMPSKFVGWRWR